MNRKTIAGVMLVGFVAVGFSSLSAVAQAHSGEHMMDHKKMKQQQGEAPGYGTGDDKGSMGMTSMGGGKMGGHCMMGMGSGMGMMGMGGHGMMGGMGMTSFQMLDLTEQQRTRINKIQHSLRKKNRNTMGKIMDEKDRLRDLYDVEKRNPKKIGAVYGRIFNLKRQMIEATITANNQQEAVLTKDQRKQLKQSCPGMHKGAGPHGRGGHGDMPGGMMGR